MKHNSAISGLVTYQQCFIKIRGMVQELLRHRQTDRQTVSIIVELDPTSIGQLAMCMYSVSHWSVVTHLLKMLQHATWRLEEF